MSAFSEIQAFGYRDDSLDAVADALGGEAHGSGKVCAPSPGRPGSDRSMVVFVDPAKPQAAFVYKCAGCVGAAIDHVHKKLAPIKPVIRPTWERTEKAMKIWQNSVPAARTIVEGYLRRRAITLPVPDSLRYHGRLYHQPSGMHWPAMVALVTGADGKPSAIHRTYLDVRGHAVTKAPLGEEVRMALGPIEGCAICLMPATDEVCVGEGIETCLSVTIATGMPAWSAISARGVTQLVLPPEIKRVTILADGDAAGEQASLAAASRWQSEGRETLIARAPWGFDFNDVLMGKIK